MDLYVRKPVSVEAYQWKGEIPFNPVPGFEPQIVTQLDFIVGRDFYLKTDNGVINIAKGYYIVKGESGKYSAIRESVFKRDYEKVTNASLSGKTDSA